MAEKEVFGSEVGLKLHPEFVTAILTPNQDPKFIVIDGPPASGKTTLAKLLQNFIQEKLDFVPTSINTDFALKSREEYRGPDFEYWWRKFMLFVLIKKYLEAQTKDLSSVTINRVYQHGTKDSPSQLIPNLDLPITPLTIIEGVMALSAETVYLLNHRFHTVTFPMVVTGLSHDQIMINDLKRAPTRGQSIQQQTERLKNLSLPNWEQRKDYVYQQAQWLFELGKDQIAVTPKPVL